MRDRGVLLLEAGLSAAMIDWVGFAAAFCTTAAFVPQLVRVVKLKSAREISLGTFVLFTVGVALWLMYGIYVRSKPVIVSNLVTFGLSLSILVMKLRYDRNALKEMEP
jgi:MtN3 and saliva related transmembrane protein